MRSSLPILAFLLAAAPARARDDVAPHAAVRELTLFVGEQRVLPAGDIDAISPGVPGVVELKPSRDQRKLVVTAVRQGETSLLLIYRDGRAETLLFTVFARPPELVAAEARRLLDGVPGVKVRELGGRVFLDGRVPDEGHLSRLDRVAALYPDQVRVLARVDARSVERRVNVRLDVWFVDLSRNAGWRAGMNWPASLPGAGAQTVTLRYDLLAGSAAAGYSVSSNALPTLDLLSFSGWAKVRKQATVVTTNGTAAKFRAGGEINVAIGGAVGGELRAIPFGADLAVTPRFDEETGRVELAVTAEAAELSAASVGGVPGRSLSRVDTTVHVRPGETVVLSGIDSHSERESEAGLPLLRRLPLLGYLFASEDAAEDRREGLIFITPTVLDAIGEADERRVRELLDRYRGYGP